MRISIRGIDIGFVYPCTRREVIEVFGRDLLKSASFEAKYKFHESRQGKQKPFRGVVLAQIYESPPFPELREDVEARLGIYQTRAAEFSEHVGHQLVRLMRDVMKPWAEKCLIDVEENPVRGVSLVATLGNAGLELYEIRSLMKTVEFTKL